MIRLGSISTETMYSVRYSPHFAKKSNRQATPTFRHLDNIPPVVHRSSHHCTLAFAQARRRQPHRTVYRQESGDARRTRAATEEVEGPVLGRREKGALCQFRRRNAVTR